jgi:serine/threonine protein kinase
MTTPVYKILNAQSIKSKCIVYPAFGCGTDMTSTGPDYVSAVLVGDDEKYIMEYNTETDPELLRVLREIDPNMHRFVYASSVHIGCKLQSLTHHSDVLSKCGLSVLKQQNGFQFYNSPLLTQVFTPGNIPQSYKPYVLDSLQLLHSRNIIHGDTHAANIGIYNGRVVLFDFGLAKFTTSQEYKDHDIMMLNTTFIPDLPRGLKRSRSRFDEDFSPSGKDRKPPGSPSGSPSGPKQGGLKLSDLF